MNNKICLVIGLIIGYFMAMGLNSSVMASEDVFTLGSRYNPMYVKIVK